MLTRKRELRFDVIRVVAILMVLLVHVSAYLVIKYPNTSKAEFIIANVFNGLSRAGVPLFVMLSGALLLNEDRPFDTKTFYKKSLLTMGLLLVGWLAFYAALYGLILPPFKGEAASLKAAWDFIVSFKGTDCAHLWYLFMVVGLYLMIPVLRLFVKRENRPYILGAVIACFVAQNFARTAELFTMDWTVNLSAFIEKFHMEPCTGYIGYLLLGWYLTNFEPKKPLRLALYALAAVVLILSILFVQSYIDYISNIRTYLYGQLSLMPYLYGAALFVLISQLCKGKETTGKLTASLSRFSFGIYIIHILFYEIFTLILLPYAKFPAQDPLLYMALSYVFVLVLSYLTVWLLSKCSFGRKIFYIK